MKSLLMAASSLSVERYPLSVLQDIVSQITFRNNSPIDEKTKQPVSLFGGATISNNRLVALNASGSYGTANIGYFGGGDFTYEVMFQQTHAVSNEGVALPCHWYLGNITNTNNRWLIMVMPDGAIGVVFALSGTAYNYTWRTSVPGVMGVIGKEYHVVVERYNDIIKVFVDGVERLSWSQPGALWATTGNYVADVYGGYGYAGHTWRNLRIAKRAMYQHSVITPRTLPRI